MKKLILILTLLGLAYVVSAGDGKPSGERAAKQAEKFAKTAAEKGLLEVKLAQLAQNRGSSAVVKDLAKKMENDHSKANDELRMAAASRNISVPEQLSEKAQRKYDKLAEKTGEDFDKAYTKCMVKDHKKNLAMFKKEAKKEDSQFKDYASNKVPVLEHHLHMSKDACDQVKKNNKS